MTYEGVRRRFGGGGGLEEEVKWKRMRRERALTSSCHGRGEASHRWWCS